VKTKIHHGPTSIHRGEVGSHVELHLLAEAPGEWSGVYNFSSHGMSPQDFVRHVHGLTNSHQIKTRRLNGFVSLRKKELIIGADTFRIIDCNLAERGNDFELLLGVVRVVGENEFEPRLRLDARDGLLYPSLDAVPDDAEIEDMVRTLIGVGDAQKAEHASFLAEVAALMGGQ
jgi:hypothetical protein